MARTGAALKLRHAIGDAPPPRLHERASRRELIDPLVEVVIDIDVAGAVDGDALGAVELPGAPAWVPELADTGARLKLRRAVGDAPPPGLYERAGGGELIDPLVVKVSDVDIPLAIRSHSVGVVELAGTIARNSGLAGTSARLKRRRPVGDAPPPSLHERPRGGELLDPAVSVIGHVDSPRPVRRDAVCKMELAGAGPVDPGLAGTRADLKLRHTIGDAPPPRPDERARGGELNDPAVVISATYTSPDPAVATPSARLAVRRRSPDFQSPIRTTHRRAQTQRTRDTQRSPHW